MFSSQCFVEHFSSPIPLLLSPLQLLFISLLLSSICSSFFVLYLPLFPIPPAGLLILHFPVLFSIIFSPFSFPLSLPNHINTSFAHCQTSPSDFIISPAPLTSLHPSPLPPHVIFLVEFLWNHRCHSNQIMTLKVFKRSFHRSKGGGFQPGLPLFYNTSFFLHIFCMQHQTQAIFHIWNKSKKQIHFKTL